MQETEVVGDLPAEDWRRNLRAGDEVWWNDPDHHKSSGMYTITQFNDEAGIDSEDSIVMLRNEAGSQAEVYASELSPSKPDDLHPVVDGVEGDVTVYGYASSKEDAIDVGNETFEDEVVDAYLAENIVLIDGSTVDKAWVAITRDDAEKARIRLVLDVEYNLGGMSVQDMIDNLRNMVSHAMGEGLLTGYSSAEVESHTVEIMEVPKMPEEDDVADYLLSRIENGNLALEDIPVRMARYGLMDPVDFALEMRERMDEQEEG